jgi:hypothetical protein
MDKGFPFRLKRSFCSGAHPASSPKDNKFILLGVKRPERETDHLPLSITDVKKSEAVNVLLQDDLIAFLGLHFTGPSEFTSIQQTKSLFVRRP